MAESEKSVVWVIGMVMLLVAAFGWAFMAAAYAHVEEGWRTGGVTGAGEPRGPGRGSRGALGDFVGNAVRQVPNAATVVGFNLQHRLWLVLLTVGLEVGAVFGGWKMKQLERELQSGPRRRGR